VGITSYTDYTAALASLVVEGVTRRYTSPPSQLHTADLPAQFVRLPEGREGPLTADGEGGWPALTAELVIAVEPVHQNTPAANYATTVALVDAVSAALRAVTPKQVCKSKLSWTIGARRDVLGEQEYWLLVARVTGQG
jgi:hypothetical protein